MKDVKGQLLTGAMKVMQSDTARKVMSSPHFQNAMAFAFKTTFKVKNDIDSARKNVASALNLVTKDELRDLQRNVERLERRLKRSENTENL